MNLLEKDRRCRICDKFISLERRRLWPQGKLCARAKCREENLRRLHNHSALRNQRRLRAEERASEAR